MKITGFDEFGKHLNKMQKGLEELGNTNYIPFNELITDSFVRKNTNYSSVDELIEKSGFQIETQEDFDNVPEENWNKFISENSKFKTFQGMIDSAGEEYVAIKMGFA